MGALEVVVWLVIAAHVLSWIKPSKDTMEPISTGRAVVDVLKSLIPPSDNDPRITSWRWSLIFVLGINTVANTIHILWACGWLMWAGLHGFVLQDAYAVDESKASISRADIEKKIDLTQFILINQALKDALKTRCISILQSNQAALDSANRDISAYEDQYYSLIKRPFMEPPCSVVLIAKVP